MSPYWLSDRPVYPNDHYYGTKANHQQCLWVHWTVRIKELCNLIQTSTYASTLYLCWHKRFVWISWLCRLWKRKRTQKLQRKCAHCYLKDDSDTKDGDELCENCKLRDWLSNYRLNDVDSFSLFREFLEMGMCFFMCHASTATAKDKLILGKK